MRKRKEEWHRNKDMCLKCKFHGWFGPIPPEVNRGLPVKEESKKNVYCAYGSVGRGTALKNVHGKLVDQRGKDKDHCKLFEAGDGEKGDNW